MDDYYYNSDGGFDFKDDGTLAISFVGIGRRKSQTHQPLSQVKNCWIPLIAPRHKLSYHATLLVHLQQLIQPNPTHS